MKISPIKLKERWPNLGDGFVFIAREEPTMLTTLGFLKSETVKLTIVDYQPIPGCSLEIGPAIDFSEDIELILDFLEYRGHVGRLFLESNIPRAILIALIRCEGKIVSVCMLKGMNRTRVTSVSEKSGFSLNEKAMELGYAATDEHFRGLGLSRRLHEEIVTRSSGLVFATVRTSNIPEQHTLRRLGFNCQGMPWAGIAGDKVALWVLVK